MLHIVERPDLPFAPCRHKPTAQQHAILPEGGTCETQYGTMAFRAGDHLMVGANGALYVLSHQQFLEAYEQ